MAYIVEVLEFAILNSQINPPLREIAEDMLKELSEMAHPKAKAA